MENSQKRLDESVICHESYKSDGKEGHSRLRNNLRENTGQENAIGDRARDGTKLNLTRA